MRIAVFGALGQLGHALCPRLSGEVTALGRADGDLAQPGSALRLLAELKPDVVINCAAHNFVDRAESEPEAAFAVNAWAVREMALVCRELNCLLVHFSSDYVFGLDATRTTPWIESDAPGPVSIYGLSKLTGEYLVRALCPRHLVIRTCGLYGEGDNFVGKMLELAKQGKPLRVVNDQVCTPSSAADVAAGAGALLEKGVCGLFHLTNAGCCSWYEFANAIFELAGMNIEVSAITSVEYGAVARRPAYSVLSGEKYGALGLPSLRGWREALAEYLEQYPLHF